MTQKSWQLNRRELLKGGGVALALPFLNGMTWAKDAKELPKRMLVTYISYGVYMPNGPSGVPGKEGVPHHDWSW